MSKIDIDKFVASVYKHEVQKLPSGGQWSTTLWTLDEALREQGLKYKAGEIIELSNLEQNGKNSKPANFAKSCKDLQELTEFEYFLKEIVNSFFQRQGEPSNTEAMTNEGAKNYAKKLLEIAYKQFNKAVNEEIKRRFEGIDVNKMADDYYDALMKEAAVWMDEGTMCHCRLAYYNGCKDVLNKIQKGE